MRASIKYFIDELSEQKVNESIINHYSLDYNLITGAVCQNNLLCYLVTMQKEIKPKTILLGEAPGYKGCTLTGVPFTSEAIIGSGNYQIFNYTKETQELLSKQKTPLQSESTATIVWNTLKELNIYPLLWNAFPFSPIEPFSSKPNRTPTLNEVEKFGKKYFLKLIELIPIKNFVAIGKVAAESYKIFGVSDFQSIRHPSYGGKSDFAKGLQQLKQLNYF